jgi:TonB family protein
MLELKSLVPKIDRFLPAAPPDGNPEERKQRRMMIIALVLLLVALGFVLYHDRDFWFPETQEAEETPQPQQTLPAATNPKQPAVAQPVPAAHKKSHNNKQKAKVAAAAQPAPRQSAPAQFSSAQSASTEVSGGPINAVTTRTVLPPLEVEVVAGDVHRTVHPGTNSVRVDLQPGAPPQSLAVPPATTSAASVTSNAAERVQMSADTAEVVSRPVKPDYPLLARQMKVQGSVILQALIGRDGLIQDLHVLSGPPILASAAQEAVKQWHFKPHYQGAQAVETQARITVNFTISTN